MTCNCQGHSVTSAHVDLAIDNNGTWQDAFQFGTTGDVTWTLIGQHFLMDVKINRYDASPLLSLTTADGSIVTDDNIQRVVHLNVSPATIQADLPPGRYVYDFVMIDASNPAIRVPLMHGNVTVAQGVSYP